MRYVDEGKYIADVTEKQPTLIMFLVDFSMSAEEVCKQLNIFLYSLITSCARGDGIRSYFDICVICYGCGEPRNVARGLLSNSLINSISSFDSSPLRVEDRKKKVDDGAGGLIEIATKFPVWFEENYKFQPNINTSNDLNLGLVQSAKLLVEWCERNTAAYPPTFIHVGIGDSINSESERIISLMKEISTRDGEVVVFNVDLDSHDSFPEDETKLALPSSRKLFQLASDLPLHYGLHLNDRQKYIEHNNKKLPKCYLSLEGMTDLSYLFSTLIGSEGDMYRSFFWERR
jgi:hypothetical protein